MLKGRTTTKVAIH